MKLMNIYSLDVNSSYFRLHPSTKEKCVAGNENTILMLIYDYSSSQDP